MIDRITHHVHSSAGLNSNQYGFIPQRGTVDAVMAVKEIIEENLKKNYCTSVACTARCTCRDMVAKHSA
jgi:hypothetical protein